MKLVENWSLIYLLFIILIGCQVSNLPSTVEQKESNGELNIEIECYQNRMPLSNSAPYVVIIFTPEDSVIQENLKILKLTAIGDNSEWNAQIFDDHDYKGKGLKVYQNIARSFDPTIGSVYDFKLVIQFESGNKKTFEIEGVSIRSVY